ncbi:YvrJ family protein [Mediannikoviicoccus vaginalis]|nr:YvrJ family protein [Mediannikoviicoccus vaginalis]
MTELLEYVSNIGFPIVLSWFLITRIESKLETLSESIKELAIVIEGLQ